MSMISRGNQTAILCRERVSNRPSADYPTWAGLKPAPTANLFDSDQREGTNPYLANLYVLSIVLMTCARARSIVHPLFRSM